ncbi:MAG: isoprenylcysteine carboxylmethyltransferase family protein [Bacteroidota bacterium]|nr:isoprenylcysteine carboxylmethyltransferase family protein [Bacteroidota bacterium]
MFFILISIFGIGTFSYSSEYFNARIISLICYIIFSWVQIMSVKALGQNYSQNILIYRTHDLVQKGIYKYIRHPQYLAQILADLGAGFALFSYLVLPIALIEIPIFILRAKVEDKMMLEYFKDEFLAYKKKSGFMLPFIG